MFFSEHSVLAVAGTVLSVLPWLLTLARENNRRQVSISDARRLSILWCWKLFSLSSYSPTVPIPLSHFPHLSPGFWWHCEKCSSFCITEKVSGKLESAVFLIGYQYGKEFHIFVIRTGKWHLSGERCHTLVYPSVLLIWVKLFFTSDKRNSHHVSFLQSCENISGNFSLAVRDVKQNIFATNFFWFELESSVHWTLSNTAR